MNQVVFLILPSVELLDLAGPAQTFFEANCLGAEFTLRYAAPQPDLPTAQGLHLSQLEPFTDVSVNNGDIIFVPGLERSHYSKRALSKLDGRLFTWLRAAHAQGAKICSVCTGAFVLAFAGLLNGRHCTTHWYCIDQLQAAYPKANVHTNRLFLKDDTIYTSAGIASGIDLSLSILEETFGPLFTAKVARTLVVYMRRDGTYQQQSIYLDYRSHLNPSVHQVQDWLIAHPGKKYTLEQLADLSNLSTRHLTRTFKQATGITIKAYTTQIKLEYAKTLLRNPNMTVAAVAAKCGFKDARQLRRLWQVKFGVPPSDFTLKPIKE